MAELKRDGGAGGAREPRERLESSKRRIRDPLLRERSDASSYRMTPSDREEHVAVPTLRPPPSASPRQSERAPRVAPFQPTTGERAPRETRHRQSIRSSVSQSLAAAEASAQRVIERAAIAHDSDKPPRESGRAPRRRAETIAGLGSLAPRPDAEDDSQDDPQD